MAEHSYEIVVKLKGSGGGSGGSKKEQTEDKNTASPFRQTIDFVKNSVAVKEVSGIIKQSASFTVSNVGLTTGNTESQQQAQFAMNALGTTASVVGAVATGNYLALALMAINIGTSIYFNQKQIDLEQRIENESLALSRQRAGVAFNHSRMGGAG